MSVSVSVSAALSLVFLTLCLSVSRSLSLSVSLFIYSWTMVNNPSGTEIFFCYLLQFLPEQSRCCWRHEKTYLKKVKTISVEKVSMLLLLLFLLLLLLIIVLLLWRSRLYTPPPPSFLSTSIAMWLQKTFFWGRVPRSKILTLKNE